MGQAEHWWLGMDNQQVADFNKMLEDLGHMICELDNLDQVPYGKGSPSEEQEVMLDTLLVDCDDCDDEKPLIPPRAPMVPRELSPPAPPRAKKRSTTHMWVTLPPKDSKPCGEVATDGEVTAKYAQKAEEAQDTPQSPGAMSIKVFNEDNSSVTFSASPNMTASEACHKLVVLNAFKEDPNWVIVEHLTDCGMERNLEDHENVTEVYNSWAPNSTNKLLFRRDPKKYDFFTNTASFFPDHLMEDEGAVDRAVTDQARKAKKILLQNLLSKCTRVPEICDVLQTKEFSKKSWNKKFLILRGSGFYTSLKGRSKAFKDLQSYIQFEGNNLYMLLNAFKTHKAPTSFAFCLAPLSVKESRDIKCFCTEDEKTFMSWVIGIRLAKYGSQLRENYDIMLRKFAKLAKLGSLSSKKQAVTSPTTVVGSHVNGQQSVSSDDRVAMDFTGTHGKLVTNCKEIEQLSNLRHKPHLSRRMSGNHFISNFNQTPGSELADESWFHGRISREQTLALMRKEGLEDGLFLVRESNSVTDVFVLTFCMNKKVFHCQLVQDIGPGNTMYCSLDKGPAFPCIADLINHYQQKIVNGISVALRRPCMVKRKMNLACL